MLKSETSSSICATADTSSYRVDIGCRRSALSTAKQNSTIIRVKNEFLKKQVILVDKVVWKNRKKLPSICHILCD